MKKTLFWMSVAVLVALALVVPRRSEAFGGESLGCFVNVGAQGTFTSGSCTASRPRFSYTVNYKVLNESGTYTFAWNTNGAPVSSGCTSTSDTCIISARGIPADQELTVSVTITQSGQSAALSATAFIPAVCTDPVSGGPVFC